MPYNLPSYEVQQEILEKVTEVENNTKNINGFEKYEVPGTYNWVCPPGIEMIKLSMIGGGGGGAGSGTGTGANKGGGGASGNYVYKHLIEVIPGQSYAIICGQGGAGSAKSSTSIPDKQGGTGGASSAFGITCSGGLGAIGNQPGKGVDTVGIIKKSLPGGTDNPFLGTYAGTEPINAYDTTYGGGGAAGFSNGGSATTPGMFGSGGGGGGTGVNNVGMPGTKGGDGLIIIEW